MKDLQNMVNETADDMIMIVKSGASLLSLMNVLKNTVNANFARLVAVEIGMRLNYDVELIKKYSERI